MFPEIDPIAIQGYYIKQTTSIREMLAPLINAHFIQVVQQGEKLKFSLIKDKEPVVHINEENFLHEDHGKITMTRQEDSSLPKSSVVSFIDKENNYQPGSVSTIRNLGNSQNVVKINFPMVMSEQKAKAISEIVVQQPWIAREKISFPLPMKYLYLEPGDVVEITLSGRLFDVVILKIDRGVGLEVFAERIIPSSFVSSTSVPEISPIGPDLPIDSVGPDPGTPIDPIDPFDPTDPTNPFDPIDTSRLFVELLDLPLLTGNEQSPWAPRVAAYQRSFSDIEVYRNIGDDDNPTYTKLATVDMPSSIGRTLNSLPAYDPYVFDRVNSLRVQIFNPLQTFMSMTDYAALNSGQFIAVKNHLGNWEIIRFARADLAGTGTYDLSHLIRGEYGTEVHITSSLTAYSSVVVLNSSNLSILNIPRSQINMELDLVYRRPGGSVNLDTVSYSGGRGAGIKPYAVSNLRKTTNSNKDVHIYLA